jgi:hypothetical protein
MDTRGTMEQNLLMMRFSSYKLSLGILPATRYLILEPEKPAPEPKKPEPAVPKV